MDLVGRPAPDFTLYDAQFRPVTLSSLRGKTVVLAFYPSAFTEVCTEEMCALRDALGAFDALNAVVLGISVDAPDANRVFAVQNGLSFPLLSDFTRETLHAYGVAWPNFGGIPGYFAANRAVFVVGPDGRVSWQWVGEHPGKMPPFPALHAALLAAPR
jgi:glutaredoxin-dependent peroxiredoxin